jgi:hypothetical protein
MWIWSRNTQKNMCKDARTRLGNLPRSNSLVCTQKAVQAVSWVPGWCGSTTLITIKILFERNWQDFIGPHHGKNKIFLLTPDLFLLPQQSHSIRGKVLVNNFFGFIDSLMHWKAEFLHRTIWNLLTKLWFITVVNEIYYCYWVYHGFSIG